MSSVVGDSNLSVCAACGKSGDHLKSCTACHLVKYCNRECQISHRPKHKKECRKRAAEIQRAGDNNNTSNSNVNEILSEGISNVNISAADKKMSTYEQKMVHVNNVGACEISSNITNLSAGLDKMKLYDDGEDISNDKLFADPPKQECPICMQPMPFFSSGIRGAQPMYQPCCGKVLCSGCMIICIEEMKEGNMKRLCSLCRVPLWESIKEYVEMLKKRMELNDAEAFCLLGLAYKDGDYGLQKRSQ